jgi:hypothetical protein
MRTAVIVFGGAEAMDDGAEAAPPGDAVEIPAVLAPARTAAAKMSARETVDLPLPR